MGQRTIKILSFSDRAYQQMNDNPAIPSLVNSSIPQLFQETLMCSSIDRDETDCPSDAGGPLLIRSGNGRFTQFGIMHGGLRGCGTPNWPAIILRIDHREIRSFISQFINVKSEKIVDGRGKRIKAFLDMHVNSR